MAESPIGKSIEDIKLLLNLPIDLEDDSHISRQAVALLDHLGPLVVEASESSNSSQDLINLGEIVIRAGINLMIGQMGKTNTASYLLVSGHQLAVLGQDDESSMQ
jgi:hypothetical protein